MFIQNTGEKILR